MVFQKERIVHIYSHILKPLWLSTPRDFPDVIPLITEQSKQNNETFLQKDSKKISAHFDKLNTKGYQWVPYARKRWNRKMDILLKHFFQDEPILNIDAYISQDAFSDISAELKKFLYSARQSAPELSVSDLGQAVRNYLVYAMFLELSGKKQICTPAIFGYSMLYPVTDNYIDSNRSSDEKLAYNKMIRDKIEGLPVSPETSSARQACEMLSRIESVYPRENNTDIYAGLLLMLDAQQESLVQQSKKVSLSMEERLDISLYKGGVSVLIDRYLAGQDLDDEELRFFLGFGFILQLADDLQDITSDLLEGNQTLFTLEQNQDATETLVNQLLHFIYRMYQIYTAPNADFLNFMLQSSIYLILMSAQMSQEHFRSDYLKKLESCFPVHFSFLEQYTKNSALYPQGIAEADLQKGMDMYLNVGKSNENFKELKL